MNKRSISMMGNKNARRVLTDADIELIMGLRKERERCAAMVKSLSQAEIARKFGVSKRTIERVGG